MIDKEEKDKNPGKHKSQSDMFDNDFKESVQAIEPDSIINSTIGHIVVMEKSPKREKPKI